MQHSTFIKALSITLLLSCVTHVQAMNKKQRNQQANKSGWTKRMQEENKPTAQPQSMLAPAADERSSSASPEIPASVAAAQLTKEAFDIEAQAPASPAVAAIMSAAPVAMETTTVEQLEKATTNNNSNNEEVPVKAIKSLLGKELVTVYNTDERPLVQKGLFWGTVDATQPYKDEGKLVNGLERNDSNYLKDVQAQQDLNRTLNQICAGIIQKIKEQSSLDKETEIRSFTIDQIEAIINSQYPRALVLQKILGLCEARIKAKQEPLLHPTETTKELAQKCFTALSQLQLERKRIREQEENNRIRQIKAGQRLVYAMRLIADKGTISDDEYSDSFIFNATTGE